MPEYPETKRVSCGCGGKALLAVFESPEIMGNRVYSVVCEECHMKTDYFPTAEEACQSWNRAMRRKAGKWQRRKGSDCWECSECHAVLESDDIVRHNFYYCYN